MRHRSASLEKRLKRKLGQQHARADRATLAQFAMRLRGVAQLEFPLDLALHDPARNRIEQFAGALLELLALRRMRRQSRPGEKKRTLVAQNIYLERRHHSRRLPIAH